VRRRERPAGRLLLPGLALALGCTVTAPTERADKELVRPDAPVFEQSLRDIDPDDLDLSGFWLHPVSPPTHTAVPLTDRTVVDLVARVRGGVVNLYSEKVREGQVRLGLAPGDILAFRIPLISPILDFIPFQIPVPYRERGVSLGSGFVINAEGYVLTNAHVVHNATEVRVVLSEGGQDRPAKIVGIDLLTDTALIKMDPVPGLVPLPLGDSNALEVGEMVIAVGNPLGLRHTVTSGLVSAKERVLPEGGETQLVDLIQTDSAINPGSSGGPLLNLRGEVVGINTAIASQAQLIGFAVPIDVAKEVMPLLVLGRSERGWLGATAVPLEGTEARAMGLEGGGALIRKVEADGPAAAGGLREEDVVVGVNGERVDGFLHFRRKLLGLLPGQTISVTVLRDGEIVTLSPTLGTRPA
jgi:serine protease Do